MKHPACAYLATSTIGSAGNVHCLGQRDPTELARNLGFRRVVLIRRGSGATAIGPVPAEPYVSFELHLRTASYGTVYPNMNARSPTRWRARP